jgi:L-fuconolactonase
MTELIDSHVHIWDPTVNRYDWLTGELARPYLPPEYHTAAPRTTGVIFVEASASDGLAEARWVASLDWPQLRGIVAQAALERGNLVSEQLDRLQEIPAVVGVRRLLQDEPLTFFETPELIEGLRLLAARGLPFDACIRHAQLPALTSLLRQVPDLDVVLDHLAKPPVSQGDDGTWARDLQALATALPRLRVKLSGVAPETAPDGEVRVQALPWLASALDIFGADRCMVASDWPVSAMTAQHESPGDWLDHVLEDLGASDLDREQLSWQTASGFYGAGGQRPTDLRLL